MRGVARLCNRLLLLRSSARSAARDVSGGTAKRARRSVIAPSTVQPAGDASSRVRRHGSSALTRGARAAVRRGLGLARAKPERAAAGLGRSRACAQRLLARLPCPFFGGLLPRRRSRASLIRRLRGGGKKGGASAPGTRGATRERRAHSAARAVRRCRVTGPRRTAPQRLQKRATAAALTHYSSIGSSHNGSTMPSGFSP